MFIIVIAILVTVIVAQ